MSVSPIYISLGRAKPDHVLPSFIENGAPPHLLGRAAPAACSVAADVTSVSENAPPGASLRVGIPMPTRRRSPRYGRIWSVSRHILILVGRAVKLFPSQPAGGHQDHQHQCRELWWWEPARGSHLPGFSSGRCAPCPSASVAPDSSSRPSRLRRRGNLLFCPSIHLSEPHGSDMQMLSI